MQFNVVKLRRLEDNENDYKLLEKWYQEKEVYSQFEQRILNYEEIKNKYYPRTLDDSKVPVYMILYNNEPIGIIQYQKINNENQKLYDIKDNNSYEVDIFIGEVKYHNKGIGKISIDIITDYLFNKKSASLIVMCPVINNISAIKCYEKCGFINRKTFKTENTIGNVEEFVLMIKGNNN